MDGAAMNGHVDVVKWLHDNRSEGCTTDAIDGAARYNDVAMVRWLCANRSEGCTMAAMENVAARVFHTCEKPLSESCPCRQQDPPDSFVEEQLSVLELLRSYCPGNSSATLADVAAENGNLKVLRWVHANTSATCSTRAMDSAARLGRLDILTWLHENTTADCSVIAMDAAAANRRLDILKWLHANRLEGCTSEAMDKAAANGHVEMVKWLHANRPEVSLVTAFERACGEYIPTKPPSQWFGARPAQLRVVQWLVTTCPGLRIRSVLQTIVLCSEFEVLLYLHAHCVPEYDDLSVEWAARKLRDERYQHVREC